MLDAVIGIAVVWIVAVLANAAIHHRYYLGLEREMMNEMGAIERRRAAAKQAQRERIEAVVEAPMPNFEFREIPPFFAAPEPRDTYKPRKLDRDAPRTRTEGRRGRQRATRESIAPIAHHGADIAATEFALLEKLKAEGAKNLIPLTDLISVMHHGDANRIAYWQTNKPVPEQIFTENWGDWSNPKYREL